MRRRRCAWPVTSLSNPYLSQLERGLHLPSVRVLKLLSDALNVSVETLLAQAGLLDLAPSWDGAAAADGPPASSVESAISADERLAGEQKAVAGRRITGAAVAFAALAVLAARTGGGGCLARADRAAFQRVRASRTQAGIVIAQAVSALAEPEVIRLRRSRSALADGHGRPRPSSATVSFCHTMP